MLGRALAFCGWTDGATRAFRDALREDPAFSEARARLGETLSRAGRWSEAASELAEAARQRPSDAGPQAGLVVALFRAGRGGEAVAALRRLIDLRPNEPELHILHGALLRRAHRPDEAIRSFRWAMQMTLQPQRFVLGEAVLGEKGWRVVVESFRAAAVAPFADPPAGRSRTRLQQAPPRAREARPRPSR